MEPEPEKASLCYTKLFLLEPWHRCPHLEIDMSWAYLEEAGCGDATLGALAVMLAGWTTFTEGHARPKTYWSFWSDPC